ncbi:MAG: hypothetical protein AAF556_13365, partial [Pseudomonadota bacterium]
MALDIRPGQPITLALDLTHTPALWPVKTLVQKGSIAFDALGPNPSLTFDLSGDLNVELFAAKPLALPVTWRGNGPVSAPIDSTLSLSLPTRYGGAELAAGVILGLSPPSFKFRIEQQIIPINIRWLDAESPFVPLGLPQFITDLIGGITVSSAMTIDAGGLVGSNNITLSGSPITFGGSQISGFSLSIGNKLSGPLNDIAMTGNARLGINQWQLADGFTLDRFSARGTFTDKRYAFGGFSFRTLGGQVASRSSQMGGWPWLRPQDPFRFVSQVQVMGIDLDAA